MKNRNYRLIGLVVLLGLAFLAIGYFLPIATLAALLVTGMFVAIVFVISQVISLLQRSDRHNQTFDFDKANLNPGLESRFGADDEKIISPGPKSTPNVIEPKNRQRRVNHQL